MALTVPSVASLILYSHRRDMMLDLPYPGKLTRELVYHYERQKVEAEGRVLKAAFYNSVIQSSALAISKLVEQAKDNPDRAREILKQVRQLENKAKKARKELKAL